MKYLKIDKTEQIEILDNDIKIGDWFRIVDERNYLPIEVVGGKQFSSGPFQAILIASSDQDVVYFFADPSQIRNNPFGYNDFASINIKNIYKIFPPEETIPESLEVGKIYSTRSNLIFMIQSIHIQEGYVISGFGQSINESNVVNATPFQIFRFLKSTVGE